LWTHTAYCPRHIEPRLFVGAFYRKASPSVLTPTRLWPDRLTRRSSRQSLDAVRDVVATTAALRGRRGLGKTMLAKALAHNAPPQTTSLPLRHVWRKINNCGCSVSANTRDGMPIDFLLSHFTLLGVDLQWWMPILGGVTAVYAFWLVRFGPGD